MNTYLVVYQRGPAACVIAHGLYDALTVARLRYPTREPVEVVVV